MRENFSIEISATQLPSNWSIQPADGIQSNAQLVVFISDKSAGVDDARQAAAELDGSLQRKDYFGDGDAVCMDVLLLPSADIDECADGFVECDSKSTCVNLPGWYHCECRDGYHDNGLFSTNGESCVGEWPTFALYGLRNMLEKFQT